MIINTSTVLITVLIIVGIGFGGLHLIRQFALQIAVENFEANQAMDEKDEQERKKKIILADAAASDAFQKVEPLIKKNGSRPPSPVGQEEGPESV
eukprot:CAMPEP_0204617098 /NCGR_PEP_ID=MMETSP0717-20131115/4161_1 /ASSEMBLY_ACC=CAM_ASM_000666 /TAXON_ID=230516 /ORGANISM="Chaetoceros curvisetus" /LENGTH=94 /DNA_ID=CAMNT_0051630519 /DNA_START=95 /DNA_END=379 /DNA_ORIENTATION=-